MEQFLSLQDLMRHLNISRWTVYRMIDKGALPAVKVNGRWRFKPADLQQYISKRTFQTGRLSQENLCFKPEVLDKYRNDPKKYYLIEEAFSGRLGNKEHDYLLHTGRSLAYLQPPGYKMWLDNVAPQKGFFIDLTFWKVNRSDGTRAIAVNPGAYERLPESEKEHWLRFMVR